jgi:hypothetical protein
VPGHATARRPGPDLRASCRQRPPRTRGRRHRTEADLCSIPDFRVPTPRMNSCGRGGATSWPCWRIASAVSPPAATACCGSTRSPVCSAGVVSGGWASDGHHRVSIAAATGQQAIDAYVTEILTAAPAAGTMCLGRLGLPVQNPQRPFRRFRSRRRPAHGLIEARGKVTHALARAARALHLTY